MRMCTHLLRSLVFLNTLRRPSQMRMCSTRAPPLLITTARTMLATRARVAAKRSRARVAAKRSRAMVAAKPSRAMVAAKPSIALLAMAMTSVPDASVVVVKQWKLLIVVVAKAGSSSSTTTTRAVEGA